MPLIFLVVGLSLLKYFEVWKFAEISWWWVVCLFFITFIWFEFLEKMLGLDKSKAHDVQDKIRQDRVKKEFDKRKK